jgi:hypothetical protein
MGSSIPSPRILKLYHSLPYEYRQQSNNSAQNNTKNTKSGLTLRLVLKPITGERSSNWNGQSATDKKRCRVLTGVDGVLSDVTALHVTLPTAPLLWHSRVQWMTDCNAMSVIHCKFHTLKFPLTPSLSHRFTVQPVSEALRWSANITWVH